MNKIILKTLKKMSHKKKKKFQKNHKKVQLNKQKIYNKNRYNNKCNKVK